jgi:hypothetical protein
MRVWLISIVILATVVAAPASASPPPDSLAPKGAAHNWLPKEGWVWMHRLPFEESELAKALGTTSAGIRAHPFGGAGGGHGHGEAPHIPGCDGSVMAMQM